MTMIWNVPNTLTLSRIALIPFVLFFYINGQTHWALVLFSISVATDFLDGHLARYLRQTTELGALLDPIADRFVSLAYYGFIGLSGLSPIWFISLVITRNVAQLMSVPILLWWLKKNFHVRPKQIAKWTTALSDGYIALPIFLTPLWGEVPLLNEVFILIVGGLEAYILLTYVPRLIAIATDRHDTFE